MSSKQWFWGLVVLYSVLCLAGGFWFVPGWAESFQTDHQRYRYLIESIWCPI